MSERRILFFSELPLTASTRSFLSRSSIEVEVASEPPLNGSAESARLRDEYDLVVVDDRRVEGCLGAALDSLTKNGERLLVLCQSVPDDALLDKAEAFLVEPYTQSEFIGAIGDILGSELRRALRMGVVLPATLGRTDKRVTEGTLLQISQNGCLLEVESPIGVGESLSVSFVLPSNGEELELRGTVVSGNELQLLYGLRFDDGQESERLAILVFVELGLAAGGSESPGLNREVPR